MAKETAPSPPTGPSARAFDDVPFPYACVNAEGLVLACNTAFTKLASGLSGQEGRLCELLRVPSEQRALATILKDCLRRNTPQLLTAQVLGDGQLASMMITPDQDKGQLLVQIVEGSAAATTPKADLSDAGTVSRHTVDFLSGLSHHLRTPVNGVLGIADLLAETELSKQQATYVDILSRSCNALMHLVDEIQAITLLEQGVMQLEQANTNIEDVARVSLGQFAAASEQKSIVTHLDLAEDLPSVVDVDKTKVEQILFILLDNAFRYTDQGTVTLSVAHAADTDSGGQLSISVSDTGIGIAKDRLPSLFTGADAANEDAYGNTGLGLILCHKLVELMGGVVSVKSDFGRGTTFMVDIPAPAVTASTQKPDDKKPDAAAAERVPHLRDDAGRQLNILVAEDNPVNQMLFRTILERFGHSVTVVGNGQDAVAKVQLGMPFDIILMDISMPVMDGLEATTMIRSLFGDVGKTPILALTAHALDGDREKFLNAGMDGYQSKPVDPTTLQKAISDVIENHKENAKLDSAPDADSIMAPAQSGRPTNGLVN